MAAMAAITTTVASSAADKILISSKYNCNEICLAAACSSRSNDGGYHSKDENNHASHLNSPAATSTKNAASFSTSCRLGRSVALVVCGVLGGQSTSMPW
jgi:hypothetical protein